MSSIAPVLLSGSTSGKQIKVAATATPGTAVHTAVAGAVNMDEVWLWAVNTDTVDRILTIEFGGVAAPDDNVVVKLPPKQGLFLVLPGLKLNGGLLVKAFADAANVVDVSGYVNRYTG
jgi:hypothetical protein